MMPRHDYPHVRAVIYFTYYIILRELWMTFECQQLSQLEFLYFPCSKYKVAISIQADSRWRCARICVARQVVSSSLRGRIHGGLSSECDKWNCVINMASRFNVLGDAQRLLSSSSTSIGICHRRCPGESSLPLSLFSPLLLFSLASLQGWATGSLWGPAQVETRLQPRPPAE